ncbi:MAG: DUF47 domain-containing protein [Candidatus Diapherotrites archaeon]|nr:DUF47 domain-containing protein [Candidatus Diapherotrites archaeon]
MFIPKKSRIFDVLLEHANVVEKASKTLFEIANDWSKLQRLCKTLKELESEGDRLVHEASKEIERAFIMPFDKEDVKAFSDSLDDILDNLEQAGNRLSFFELPETRQGFKDFAGLAVEAANNIKKGVLLLKEQKLDSEELDACYKRLHSIENQGDALHRQVLKLLMNPKGKKINSAEVLFIMKWKEIFQTMEDTLDKCEDIAATFDRLRIKYG